MPGARSSGVLATTAAFKQLHQVEEIMARQMSISTYALLGSHGPSGKQELISLLISLSLFDLKNRLLTIFCSLIGQPIINSQQLE